MAHTSSTPTGEPWLPEEVVHAWARARKLAWLTLAYLVTVVVALGLTMGSSQAMKSAWLDDALALIPPAAFLLSTRYTHREPNERYPYGYHRAATIAHLTGALALLAMGTFLALDGVLHLVHRAKPTIDYVTLLGHPVWRGWFMIAALLWSSVPAFFFGRAKRPLARVLHDKGLVADAEMNRADWMVAAAALLGVAGIARGWWWADAVAGGLIGLEVLRDGFSNLRAAVHDLMDRGPQDFHGERDPLVARVERVVTATPWVARHRVRLRELGHVLVGEVEVVPRDGERLLERLEELREKLLHLDWRLHEVAIAPVRE